MTSRRRFRTPRCNSMMLSWLTLDISRERKWEHCRKTPAVVRDPPLMFEECLESKMTEWYETLKRLNLERCNNISILYRLKYVKWMNLNFRIGLDAAEDGPSKICAPRSNQTCLMNSQSAAQQGGTSRGRYQTSVETSMNYLWPKRNICDINLHVDWQTRTVLLPKQCRATSQFEFCRRNVGNLCGVCYKMQIVTDFESFEMEHTCDKIHETNVDTN